MTLTNDLAESLMSALKELINNNNIIEFPAADEKLKLTAISVNKRHQFTIHVNRIVVRPDNPELKVTFLLLYKSESLLRIDIGGSDHKNDKRALSCIEGLKEIVPCPHVHIFDENYNIAYPLNTYFNYDNIENVNDLINIFIAFLEGSNICNINDYSIQPKL